MRKVDVLTDVRAECVLNGSLELEALLLLAKEIPSTNVVNLPRLHAKTYIADTAFALITSANLTPSGLSSNFEYGIGISDESIVSRIRADIANYIRVGNVLTLAAVNELKTIAADIKAVIAPAERTHEKKMSARFRVVLKRAHTAFLSAQVGPRSAAELFSDAIVYILTYGPLRTKDLHPRIQQLFPELCNDTEILVINGQQFGKKWKHAVRNVQQALKRAGRISFDGTMWRLAETE